MLSMLLNIIFVAIPALLGFAAGWWVRGSNSPSAPAAPVAPAVTPPVAEQESEESLAADHVEDIVHRLHQLTASVAADVGEHSHRVREITCELSVAGGDAKKAVLSIVQKLLAANGQMEQQLHAAEGRLKEQAKEIESHVRDARTDALTLLFNRRGFDDELSRELHVARQKGRPLCVMMMDVDHFKKFNDTYGHLAGDVVLQAVARMLRKQLADKEIVCRYGGEEFAVIFPGSDIEAARAGAERARVAIGEQVVSFEGQELRVTASAGLAQYAAAESDEQFMKRADAALYAAKHAGRDCTYWNDRKTNLPITASAGEEAAAASQQEEVTLEFMAGISDRATFCKDVERRVGEWRRGGAAVSLLLLQIDDMQEYQKKYGEKGGLVIVRAAAQFLKATVRDMDHVAYFGEGLFALLLPTASCLDAKRVAERMRRAVERCKLPIAGKEIQFTASFGVAEVASGEEAEDFVQRVQQAASSAQQQGNCVVVATVEEGRSQTV